MGYSVLGAGLAMAPRGLGSILSMLVVSRLIGRVDIRLMLLFGFLTVAASMLQMSHFDLSMDQSTFVISTTIQGFGQGFVFMPLNALAYASLPQHLRAQGATIFALGRNMSQSLGVSITEVIFANRLAVAHSDLVNHVQPGNPVLAATAPGALASQDGLLALNGEITRQSSMVGYIDCYHLGFIAALVVLPLILLVRPRSSS
jgi:DHA2 family multidrug resistance protein